MLSNHVIGEAEVQSANRSTALLPERSHLTRWITGQPLVTPAVLLGCFGSMPPWTCVLTFPEAPPISPNGLSHALGAPSEPLNSEMNAPGTLIAGGVWPSSGGKVCSGANDAVLGGSECAPLAPEPTWSAPVRQLRSPTRACLEDSKALARRLPDGQPTAESISRPVAIISWRDLPHPFRMPMLHAELQDERPGSRSTSFTCFVSIFLIHRRRRTLPARPDFKRPPARGLECLESRRSSLVDQSMAAVRTSESQAREWARRAMI